MLQKILMLIGFCIFLGGIAQADSVHICNDCSSSFSTKANKIARVQKNGNITILDVEREKIKTYKIVAYTENNYTTYSIRGIGTPANVLSQYNQAVSAKRKVNIAAVNLHIPPSVEESAYNLGNNIAARARVMEYVSGNISWYEKLASYAGVLLSIAGRVVDLNAVIELQFSDGSVGVFKVKGINSSGTVTWTFIGKDSFDADGNIIPTRPSDFSRNYEITTSATLEEFMDAAADFGIPVEQIGAGNVWNCRSMESGSTLTIICHPVS